jgi:hypothetical protein
MRWWLATCALAALGIACTARVQSLGVLDDGSGSTTGETTIAGTTTTGESTTTDKLDLPGGAGTVADDGGRTGCEKVDFLFVVDNSASMEDEQQNLVASFPGFIDAIQGTLMAQDYHIMVVDTDAESLSFEFDSISCSNNVCSCEPEPQCCYLVCAEEGPIFPKPNECAGQPCEDFTLPTGCNATLGAGKTEDPLEHDCGIAGGLRYMVDSQPDLAATFQCVAMVGAGGDGQERPIEAMQLAVTTEAAMGACNDGFLRDDAILVVTFITDEDTEEPLTPADWKQVLVDAKHGQEEAIAMLGLLGDSALPGGVCTTDQADDAPRLRSFAESFTHGSWASVCTADYTPFFIASVATIDTTCDEFVPEG